jgi:hypothetical protein
MGPILNLVTGDGKRLVDVMHLRLFRPTLEEVRVGVVLVVELNVSRADPTDRNPMVTLGWWPTDQNLLNGGGEQRVRETDGMTAWYCSRDEALKEHVRMVQEQANAKVQKALASIGK